MCLIQNMKICIYLLRTWRCEKNDLRAHRSSQSAIIREYLNWHLLYHSINFSLSGRCIKIIAVSLAHPKKDSFYKRNSQCIQNVYEDHNEAGISTNILSTSTSSQYKRTLRNKSVPSGNTISPESHKNNYLCPHSLFKKRAAKHPICWSGTETESRVFGLKNTSFKLIQVVCRQTSWNLWSHL